MNRDELRKYLQEEYEADFAGWDFSHLKGRLCEDALPWSYPELVKSNIRGKETLLDMDTGGGEFLASLGELPKNTYATENYAPNIQVASERLKALGVKVGAVAGDGALPFAEGFFDVMINRHGSYRAGEIKRLLKPGGVFLTQQVGCLNALDLNVSLGGPASTGDGHCLIACLTEFAALGMEALQSGEQLGRYRFTDMGAIVYYLKCVPWQIADFSVDKYLDRLATMAGIMEEQGRMDFICHRFYLAVKK